MPLPYRRVGLQALRLLVALALLHLLLRLVRVAVALASESVLLNSQLIAGLLLILGLVALLALALRALNRRLRRALRNEVAEL